MVQNMVQEWNMQIVDIVRLVLSCICGLLIGYERQERIRQKHMNGAGLRTHMLVALAAAALMLVSKYGFMDVLSYSDNVRVDVSRVAAGIVSGFGFIGAGIIYVRKDSIMGLTTAAGLMATLTVGMAIGAGMYACGIALTILVILIQEMNRLPVYPNTKNKIVVIEWQEKPGMAEELVEWLNENEVQIRNLRIRRLEKKRVEMRIDIERGEQAGGALLMRMQEEFSNITRIDF